MLNILFNIARWTINTQLLGQAHVHLTMSPVCCFFFRLLGKAIDDTGITTVFVATDQYPLIDEIQQHFSKQQVLEPSSNVIISSVFQVHVHLWF